MMQSGIPIYVGIPEGETIALPLLLRHGFVMVLSSRVRRFLGWAIAALILLLSSSWVMPPVVGQLPSFQTDSGQPPSSVERDGLIESTDLMLDGQRLFRIASPAVYNRKDPGSQVPVEVRSRQIETTLKQMISTTPEAQRLPSQSHVTVLDPETLEVFVQTVNGQPVLFVDDDYLAESRVILTVTDVDAQYHGVSNPQLAERWQGILTDALKQALQTRQPSAQQSQITRALSVILVVLVASLGLLGLRRFLAERKEALEALQVAQKTAQKNLEPLQEVAAEDARFLFFEPLRQRLSLQRRLQIVQFLRWLLLWSVGFVWVSGVAASLYTFPQTRRFALAVVSTPILILIAWFVTGLLNRLLDFGIDRLTDMWEQENEAIVTAITIQRIFTITTAIKGLKTLLVYGIGILWVLQELNLVPGSVLALGALLALALSFTAQSLVKDMINGFLILAEDHFGIGDQIAVNGVSGLVENLTLRVTQVRTDNGNLVTIPNSQIAQVENMSRTWSRCNFVIEVAYNTDIDKVLDIIREEVHQMAQEPEWRSLILSPDELLGVDELSHHGIRIRLWIRTLPLKQWSVAREFRRRLKQSFEAHQIQIGIPQQLLMGQLDGLTDDKRPVDAPKAAPK